MVVKELVERDFGYVKECLNGGGLFGKVRELFGIHKEYFWRGLVSLHDWLILVRVRENGKVNTLRIINKRVKGIVGYKRI